MPGQLEEVATPDNFVVNRRILAKRRAVAVIGISGLIGVTIVLSSSIESDQGPANWFSGHYIYKQLKILLDYLCSIAQLWGHCSGSEHLCSFLKVFEYAEAIINTTMKEYMILYQTCITYVACLQKYEKIHFYKFSISPASILISIVVWDLNQILVSFFILGILSILLISTTFRSVVITVTDLRTLALPLGIGGEH